VLDVGCGAGAALAPAAQRAASAVGVELSPAMAERARVAAPSAEVLVGDAAALDLPDRSFDVVVSAFVVFFMPDPTAALREWRRLLRPGGRLVIATWGRADPRWSWERELRMEFAGEMNPETVQELRNGIGLLTRFEEPTKVEEELRAASFMPDLVTPHVIDFVFGGPDAWWEWNWSHGARMFLERLSADAQERFREKAYTAMQVSRDGHGFPRTYTALFSRAVATADR